MADLRIVLTGMRGTGKSTIAGLLEESTGFASIDTDILIEERTGLKIPEIFARSGESGFREIETNIISHLPEDTPIISTGGGVITNSVNIPYLRKNSLVIYLHAEPEILTRRIRQSDRPPLTELPAEDEMKKILLERRQMYRSAADVQINTDILTPEETTEKILHYYRDGIGTKAGRISLINSLLNTRIKEKEKTNLKELIHNPRQILYGILGNPCMHSLSPGIWNQLFNEYNIPAHYTWFEYEDPEEFLKYAIEGGVRGCSVTIPHKEKVIPYLDEITHDASTIGAVNTLLFFNDKIFGYNTDWKGIYRPLEGAKGEIAVIIGAGGAAAAATYAASMRGFTPYILNRNPGRAKELAERFGAEFGSLEMIHSLKPDLLINATPVGMGNDNTMPVPSEVLKPGMRIFDLVYTPSDTPLLKTALSKGCYVIPGTEMFIHQLVEQFRIITGIDVSSNHIRELIR